MKAYGNGRRVVSFIRNYQVLIGPIPYSAFKSQAITKNVTIRTCVSFQQEPSDLIDWELASSIKN